MESFNLQFRSNAKKLQAAINSFEELHAQASTSPRLLKAEIEVIERVFSDMMEIKKKILDELLATGCSEDEFHQANFEGDQLAKLVYICRAEFEEFNCQANQPIFERPLDSKQLRLPTIEWIKFDGDIKKWLGFWGQFRKVHEDKTMSNEDKFHYLLQATVPNSKARRLVESIPITTDGYEKAISLLKERFAHDDWLIEVYFRELLSSVMKHVVNRSSHNVPLPLSNLYDEVSAQLHALEALNIKMDQYALLLYPLIESALPNDVIKAWERKRENQNSEPTAVLGELMTFIKAEVNSDERISRSRQPLTNTEDQDVATASTFVSGHHNPAAQPSYHPKAQSEAFEVKKTAAEVTCIFCTKGHASHDCQKAQSWSMEEKKKAVKSKNCCLVCLKAHR
ncbi:unnamed protein product, partial [Nesidiocoris tenuis]